MSDTVKAVINPDLRSSVVVNLDGETCEREKVYDVPKEELEKMHPLLHNRGSLWVAAPKKKAAKKADSKESDS